MKKDKNFSANELMVDVVDYAFVEWLVRRHLYSAFRSNFLHFRQTKEAFRSALRRHIRYSVCTSFVPVNTLLLTAFSFISTPEGYDFWDKRSNDWAHFCDELLKAF